MKWTRQVITAVMAVTVMVSPALAAAGSREGGSNFFVWAFLGVCALILVLQLAPVVSQAFGVSKESLGVSKWSFGGKKKDESETETSKDH
ncbi:MAG: hypothetical protein KAT20_07065 [Desulfuromonadales bacterium]|nr:hypothetical protein [Desulfuromonadales bacterium]